MNELFGVSMTYVMIGLLVVLGIALATIGWIVAQNRIMFLVGVRNIPRRRAQTTLIIIGLMLSTLIIATAFSIGDTVDYSITTTAYDRLHSIDETVGVQSGEDEDPLFGAQDGLTSAQTIAEGQVRQFIAAFKGIDGVDGALGVVRGPASAQNVTKQQIEPFVAVVGIPADGRELEGFEADLETLDGQRVTPADLSEGEIYATESMADALDIEAGDEVTLRAEGQAPTFTVKDILKDRLLAGAAGDANEGFLLPRERAQELFGRPGQIDFIAVSNDGGVRDSLGDSDRITDELNALLQGTRLTANDTKAEAVEAANEASSFLVTFFVILGLFSIAAGMLLIFLIFVMLAAERKVEMGMMRAVGTQRSHLVQSFMSEGMVYNLGAAAVGCLLGIVVSMALVGLMARIFADFDLSIQFNVSARSLIVSYSVGVVLTFLTVTFSSWRIGNLNIVSAIRDLPEPPAHGERPQFRSGLRGALSFVRWLFFKPETLREWLRGPALVILALVLGGIAIGMFTFVGPLYDTSAAGAVVAVVLAVLGGVIMVAAVATLLVAMNTIFRIGALLVVAGVLLMVGGVGIDQAGPFGLGLSALVFGAAMVLAQLRFPARPVYTTAGLFLLVAWLLLANGRTPFERINELEGDIEMFFISGVSMVLASTFVLVYNADLLLQLLRFTGGLFPRLVPSIRTAVAYPLANKFRTGMTVAMISLVMFALVMMSTMQFNFDRIFLSDDARGGYDIIATENPGNPLDDIGAALDESGGPTRAIEQVDTVRRANPNVSDVARGGAGAPDWENYAIIGLDDGFIENNELKFQSRATGFSTDEDVWDALGANSDYAVIDAFALPSEGFGSGAFTLDDEDIDPDADTFEPVTVRIRDAASGQIRSVQIIGVLNTAGSGIFGGLLIPDATFEELYGRGLFTTHYVRLVEGADSGEVARQIESSLLVQGVEAESIPELIDEYSAQNRGFLYLIQGFMGIGLFVGIAAIGVVAFRTVVERRQQIGMLRAIGYTRGQIGISFLMESTFTALLGILSGIALALMLAYVLITSDELGADVESFYIPWDQIAAIGGFALVASILMTIIPSRQAASIPIAEALRYE